MLLHQGCFNTCSHEETLVTLFLCVVSHEQISAGRQHTGFKLCCRLTDVAMTGKEMSKCDQITKKTRKHECKQGNILKNIFYQVPYKTKVSAGFFFCSCSIF